MPGTSHRPLLPASELLLAWDGQPPRRKHERAGGACRDDGGCRRKQRL